MSCVCVRLKAGRNDDQPETTGNRHVEDRLFHDVD
jgi:hypothetical protein